MKIRAFFVFSGSNLYIFEFRRLNTKYIEFIKASFEGMTRKKMLEIQVFGRHNLEPHLFSSFHTLIFGHEDLAQLFIPKNAVF